MTLGSAVIVEPRNHAALPSVMENIREGLGKDVPILLYHGSENAAMATKLASELPNVILRNTHQANLSMSKYSNLLRQRNFWKDLEDHAAAPNSTALIFQTDAAQPAVAAQSSQQRD